MIIKSQATLNDFRASGNCHWCGQWCHRRDPHHIFPSGHGGGSRLDISINLMAVHRLCHDIVQEEMQETCLGIVASREGVLQADIVDAIMLLRRLPKRPTQALVAAEVFEMSMSATALVWRSIDGFLLDDVA